MLKNTFKFYIEIKMKKWKYLFFVLIFYSSNLNLSSQTIITIPSEQQISPTMLIEYETKLEQQRTEYVQKNILDKIFGPNRSTVMIDITLGLRTTTTKQQASEKKVDAKRKLGETEYLLPGIPKPGSIAESTVPAEAKGEASGTEIVGVKTEIVIERQNVTVIYDERIKEEKVEIAREAIASALAIRRPQEIVFKKAKFTTDLWNKFIESIVLPKYFIPLLLTLLLLAFLFGPIANFLKNYLKMLREKAPTEISIDSKLAREGETPEGEFSTEKSATGGIGVGATATTEQQLLEKEKQGEEKYIPFSYINDDNIKRLIYLIAKEKPEDIAIVLSYLKPEYVKQIIESFKPHLQAKVALALAQAREIPQEDVMRMDNYVKERIDFLVGGLHHLIELLQKVDATTRDNILEYLKNEKPDIYKKVRPQIFIFEDIADIPDVSLQVIIRELKPENIARVLRNAPQNIIDKFFKNMSEGAQALVKEEMEYGRPMTKEQIEEERNKLIELIKKLEQEGKIYLKEKEKTFLVDASEVIVSKSTKIEESPGYEYYIAGVELYQQGNYEEAINYLSYAIELDPQLSEAYQYIANILYESGNYQDALQYYKKVLELEPQNQELAKWVEDLEKSLSLTTK
ncbi:MAG: FliG C-terminal domain-containing protein [Elusimicrobiota bacterium]|nr:tetratricopeptide repeat protein [Endomicrobiia bacterium]MDW8165056.1 FliG C-terminal domain-containing protein [Elusimicrobiota bacterium]